MLLAAAFLIALAPAPAFAQVIYEQEVNVPSDIPPVIANVQTPTSPGDPLYNPTLDPAQLLISDQLYYRYTTSTISSSHTLPAAIKLNSSSLAATTGLQTNDPQVYLLSSQTFQFYRYDVNTGAVETPITALSGLSYLSTLAKQSRIGRPPII